MFKWRIRLLCVGSTSTQITPRKWQGISTLVLKISSILFSLVISTVTCHNFLTGWDACWLLRSWGGCKEERPHKLCRILNIICHQTRQRPNTSNRLIMFFYRWPPPLELEYTITGKKSYCNTLHFRFCIINLRFYCKFYFIPVGLGPYIVNFTSWNVCQDRL